MSWCDLPPQPQTGEQQPARQQEAQPRHLERREALQREPHRQVRRPPDDVEREKAEQQEAPVGRGLGGFGGRGRARHGGGLLTPTSLQGDVRFAVPAPRAGAPTPRLPALLNGPPN